MLCTEEKLIPVSVLIGGERRPLTDPALWGGKKAPLDQSETRGERSFDQPRGAGREGTREESSFDPSRDRPDVLDTEARERKAGHQAHGQGPLPGHQDPLHKEHDARSTKGAPKQASHRVYARVTLGYELAYIAFDGEALHVVARPGKAGIVKVSLSGTTDTGAAFTEAETGVSISLDTGTLSAAPALVLGDSGTRLQDADTPPDPGTPDLLLVGVA